MSAWSRGTMAFAGFTLQEYLRSGRIAVEGVAVLAAVWLLFWPRSASGLDGRLFFSLGGLFLLALGAYTAMAIMRLGNRPQGYVLLARRLGRSGYLLGLYLASIIVVLATYLSLSLVVALIYALYRLPLNLTLAGWWLGTVPLVLDMALAAAFMTLLSPLVMSAAPRLTILALFVVALSTDLTKMAALPIANVLGPLQMLLGLPLLPVMGGFALAVQQTYGPGALGIIAGQVVVGWALLTAAVYAFERRDLILSS